MIIEDEHAEAEGTHTLRTPPLPQQQHEEAAEHEIIQEQLQATRTVGSQSAGTIIERTRMNVADDAGTPESRAAETTTAAVITRRRSVTRSNNRQTDTGGDGKHAKPRTSLPP